MHRLRKWGKRLLKVAIFMVILILFLEWWLHLAPPETEHQTTLEYQRESLGENHYKIHQNWLKKNEYGLWDAYVHGEPFERGAILGNLAQELIIKQEKCFVDQIKVFVPSNTYLYFLRYMIGFFNRNLDEYVPIEYQQEIYGETFYCTDEFDAIGSGYERILNYHAAHDIGHALKDYAMVGCTSFATWDEYSEDSLLVIGRNFDFYVGDDFAEDKMVLFLSPTEGYKFASVTWGGFLGVVSGMNEKGLTVTLNAAKSGLPTSAKTPISIVARDILQYAQNIDEAFAIAQKHETFVSESILIGSAQDGKAAIIEKSIDKIALYYSDSNRIICSNHYQSDSFKTDKDNLDNIATTASNYRQKRTDELLKQAEPLNYQKAVAVLRDRKGLHGKNIGLGNEKALNQLLGHHSVVFLPEKQLMWVSTAPYQLGSYVCYDLNSVFRDNKHPVVDYLVIDQDSFVNTEAFTNYVAFHKLKQWTAKAELDEIKRSKNEEKIITLNPEYYHAYELAGNLYQKKGDYENAIKAYQKALTKEIATVAEKQQIENALMDCQDALQALKKD